MNEKIRLRRSGAHDQGTAVTGTKGNGSNNPRYAVESYFTPFGLREGCFFMSSQSGDSSEIYSPTSRRNEQMMKRRPFYETRVLT